LLFALCESLATLSCGRRAESDTSAHEVRVAASASAAAASKARQRDGAALTRLLESFVEPLALTAGEAALVPSPRSLVAALDSNQPTLMYSLGVVEQIGARESRVRWLNGEQREVPNALVIPLGENRRAPAGKLVLTSWTEGSGLTLAFTLPASEPDAPLVHGVEASDAAMAKAPRRLEPNSFRVLTAEAEVGAPVACRYADRVERFLVLRKAAELVLAFGFGGRIEVLPLASCRGLPLSPTLRAGDRVFVPIASVFARARVERVELDVGWIHLDADFAGETRPLTTGVGNVATALPP
jgi:hypothetical protein